MTSNEDKSKQMAKNRDYKRCPKLYPNTDIIQLREYTTDHRILHPWMSQYDLRAKSVNVHNITTNREDIIEHHTQEEEKKAWT